ncbi:hypothetical protein BGLT_02490 [Caballeronia glathei]|nr:hypothetical protein BGLT_02490 [Caballeronia glathei]
MNFLRRLKGLSAALGASMAVLSACAPIPKDNAGASLPPAPNPASAAQATVGPPAPPAPPGEQRITVGGANTYHVTIKVTPPSQVCDDAAFADGVRYGYALTWNRLQMEHARDTGARTPPKRRFDPADIHSQDDQYKIQWNGDERVNACASDGYLIGRIVGTHRAGVDMRGGKPS